MTTTVRRADERDADVLADMNGIVQGLHVAAEPRYFTEPSPPTVADHLRSLLLRSNVRAWIAHCDMEPAGFVVSIVHDRPATPLTRARTFTEIDQIVVRPEFRRRGVARKLLEQALEEARSQGCMDVELTSWSFNTEAHAVFRALGFDPMLIRFRRSSAVPETEV